MPLIDEPMDESTPWFIEKLRERFTPIDTGLIQDNVSNNPVWCLTVSGFESWFAVLESTLDQTLGRRLAHASAESEELLWEISPPLPKSWIGQQKKRISTINHDWDLRGLGQLGVLESSDDSATIIVANRAFTAMAAGIGNAAWERIQERRFRFQWSDRGAGETVVELTTDPRQIPKPQTSSISWTNIAGKTSDEKRLFDRARHEVEGLWTVEGNRVMMISQDNLLRFGQLTLPYLATTERATDTRTEWSGVDEADQIVLWDAMAEASRRQFLASGELVLIASTEHWLDVSVRYLSMQGLGRVTRAVSTDEHGGVELTLPALLHPAIAVGCLLGCWERAEGRAAKATWSSDSDGHTIILQSRREIA